jgi:2-polyprenyl-3-methyl-5-hydroxy-6-metoxy-1,4-benzoquinol methylase
VHHNEKGGLIVNMLLPYSVKQKADIARRLIGSTGKVLDVGCGSGQSLSYMRRYGDWEIYGVEPNKSAAKLAEEKYNIKTFCGTLEDAKYSDNSFDIVIITHVIEHVPDPLGTLREIYRILKPGGYLIGETENISSITFKLFKEYWGFLHLPYHLFYFTKKTISNFMEKTDYKEIQIVDIFNHSGWFLSITNWINSHSHSRKIGRPWYYPLLILATFPLGLLELKNSPAITFVGKKE